LVNSTVKSVPSNLSPAIFCPYGCSGSYTDTTTIELAATPGNWFTTFAGWSGGGCSGAGTCTVTMNTPVAVTADFVNNANILLFDLIVQSLYTAPRIQDAYNGLLLLPSTNGIIAPQTFTFYENLVFASPINVFLSGGWNQTWGAYAAPGFTTIVGSLKISQGKLIVSNIKIRPL
jgi:hypothetical protein